MRNLYETTPKPKVPDAPVSTWQQTAAARMYGSYDIALSSYYTRREARLRDDPEGLSLARQERKQVESLARSRGMAPDDLHVMLTAMAECEAHPRSPENLAGRREGVREQLRLESGSTAERDALLQRYLAFSTAVAQKIPTLATRANETGAGEHPDVVRVGSRYPNTPASEEK